MYSESFRDVISRQDEEFLKKFANVNNDRANMDPCCRGVIKNVRKNQPTQPLEKCDLGQERRRAVATLWTSNSPCVLPPRDYSVPINRIIVRLNIDHVATICKSDHDTKEFVARKPCGITSSTRTEQIYITDRRNHVVIVFSPEGEFQFQFGGSGVGRGKFNRPTGIAYDAVADRVIVADMDNHRIQIFNSSGQFIFSFGAVGIAPGFLRFPWGVAVSKDGQFIAVTETGNHRVQVFSKEGRFVRKFNLPSKRLPTTRIYAFPIGVAFDLTGQYLYISDLNVSCVYRHDLVSIKRVKLLNHHQLHRPSGIDVDSQGNLLVCENKQHMIKVFTPGAQLLTQLKHIGGIALEMPEDISVLRAGFIAVLDRNGRVKVF